MNHAAHTNRTARCQEHKLALITQDQNPFRLELGGTLDRVRLAYQIFGPDDAESTVLVCHALTGDSRVTRHEPDDPPGWWESLVGPGRPIDTRRTRVICSNVLGGCSGSTGPTSIDPQTGTPYRSRFPDITIGDMVSAQSLLLDQLGVTTPITVIGGSIGGFQALEWTLRFPERVEAAIVLAAAPALPPFGIAFNSIAREAIRLDPGFSGGRYPADLQPARGLSLARQLAHLTYRTSEAFDRKFGRSLSKQGPTATPRFEVESYLHHRGNHFVNRFDANSYITLTQAMDRYEAERGRGTLREAFSAYRGRLLVGSFTSDWLFPPQACEAVSQAATEAGVSVENHRFETDEGHDAFLLQHPSLESAVRSFLESAPAEVSH